MASSASSAAVLALGHSLPPLIRLVPARRSLNNERVTRSGQVKPAAVTFSLSALGPTGKRVSTSGQHLGRDALRV